MLTADQEGHNARRLSMLRSEKQRSKKRRNPTNRRIIRSIALPTRVRARKTELNSDEGRES
jgi:hypothetical protein